MDHNNNINNNNNNWLAFSLSNPHPLSLFHADIAAGTAPNQGPSLDLSIFLGAATTTTAQHQLGLDLSPFSAADQTLPLCDNHQIYYGSELKGIAASFLRRRTDCTSHTKKPQPNPVEPSLKKAVDTFGQRTSIYRGVTRHRWTGRYEAHLWDNSCRREGQSRKGRQVYLGGYDKEEKAGRAYDLAALKYWGPTTTTNFPISNYEKELEEMKNMTRQEFVASLRRKSSGFSRGASMYRGVTRHHQHGRWQARIGRVAGNKDLYLGTFSTQEEAAEAYDIAAIKFRGLNAVTNFDMSRYDVKSIASSNLPIGGMSNKSNNTEEEREPSTKTFRSLQPASSSSPSFALPMKQDPSDHYWSLLGYHNNNAVKSPGHVASLYHGHQPQHEGAGTTGVAAFQASSSTALTAFNMEGNNDMLLSGGGGEQMSSTSSGSILPFGAAPISVDSNSSNEVNYEGSAGSGVYGSWVSPTMHTFQSAKPTLSVFQTPIFGME